MVHSRRDFHEEEIGRQTLVEIAVVFLQFTEGKSIQAHINNFKIIVTYLGNLDMKYDDEDLAPGRRTTLEWAVSGVAYLN